MRVSDALEAMRATYGSGRCTAAIAFIRPFTLQDSEQVSESSIVDGDGKLYSCRILVR
jgi:hypothetical protein